jgi:hypothetical protein
LPSVGEDHTEQTVDAWFRLTAFGPAALGFHRGGGAAAWAAAALKGDRIERDEPQLPDCGQRGVRAGFDDAVRIVGLHDFS